MFSVNFAKFIKTFFFYYINSEDCFCAFVHITRTLNLSLTLARHYKISIVARLNKTIEIKVILVGKNMNSDILKGIKMADVTYKR